MIVEESQVELCLIFQPREVIHGVVTHVHARVNAPLTVVFEVVC